MGSTSSNIADMIEFYMLHSRDDGPDGSWRFLESKAIQRHPICGHVKSPPPIELVVHSFKDKTVLAGTYWNLPVLRRDLYEFLSPYGVSDARVGSIVQEDGKQFPQHVTLWSVRQVKLRGSEGADIRICEHCGVVGYSGRGNLEYVTKASIDGIEVAIADGPAFFVINSAVQAELMKKKREGVWRNLAFQPIEVREHASDGLPDDYVRPRNYLPKQ